MPSLFGGGGGGGAAGGFLGGGGHVSETRTNTETRSSTGQSYADRGSQSFAGFTLQDNATVTLSDQGAIKGAFDLAKSSLDAVLKGTSDATTAAVDAFKGAQDRAGSINADQVQKLAMIGMGALVVLVAAVAYFGRH